MNTNVNKQTVDIVDTLTNYIFSVKFDQRLVEQRQVAEHQDPILFTRELMDLIVKKDKTDEENELILRYSQQTLRTLNKEDDFVIFHLDDVRYQVKRLPESYTVYSRYQEPDFSTMPEKFKQPIANDIDVIHERFIELTSLYPAISFVKFNNKDRYSSNEFKQYCIARISTHYPVAYVSKDLLTLCDKFKEAFSAEQLAFIEEHRENSFEPLDGAQKSLEKMFSAWKKLLTRKKATAAKPFSFNDCDNHAYLQETETHLLMSQRSQNTLYAYVLEKSTGRYKVWTASRVVEAPIDDFYYSEMIEDCVNYLEMVKYYIGRDYGTTDYPVMLTHKGYVQSAEYHLTHFDDDNGLVYDSKRGCNLQSDDAGNLLSDFDLLNDVLHHYV